MTGRELIQYILENRLEDEEVCKDGKILGFMTVKETALKFGVGTATVDLYICTKSIPSINIGGNIFIPMNVKFPKISDVQASCDGRWTCIDWDNHKDLGGNV